MHNFAPPNYLSPFCLLSDGITNEFVESRKSDIVYSDDLVMALISSRQFIGTPHEGQVLIVPKKQFENIFDLPSEYLYRIAEVSKKVATGMKQAYKCDGITIWQNNGPSVNQTVWHYHVHIIPRFNNDNFLDLLNRKNETFCLMKKTNEVITQTCCGFFLIIKSQI